MKRFNPRRLAALLMLASLVPAPLRAQGPQPTPATTTPPPQQQPQPQPTPAPQDDPDDEVVRITSNLVQFDAVGG